MHATVQPTTDGGYHCCSAAESLGKMGYRAYGFEFLLVLVASSGVEGVAMVALGADGKLAVWRDGLLSIWNVYGN